MRINNVAAGYSDPTAMGKRGEAGEVAGSRDGDALEVHLPVSGKRSEALREILGRYDVTDTTPAEFTEMIQKLYQTGAISDAELQQLAAVRHDLDSDGLEPDESLDLLEYYADKIQRAQRRMEDAEGAAAQRQQLGPLLRRLDWIEKFALIQSNPDAIGLDAMA